MGRAPCCDKDGLKKGPWTADEDQKLVDYIHNHGAGNWRILPKNAGLQRCGKSCRLRWINYLRPDIKRGRFSFEEEETIIQLHGILGNKWSAIAARLPGRTDNEIKNYWNTRIRKRLLRMGIDPVTHAPRLDLLDIQSILNASNQININNMFGRAQTLVNPEILRLASVLSSQQQNPSNYVFQETQYQQQPPLMQPELHEPAAITTMHGEADYYNHVHNSGNNSYYLVPEHDSNFLNPLSEENNNGYPAVFSSTPSSSISTPINSNSTSVANGGEDIERESYSSNYDNLLNYESEFLDLDSLCNDEIQQLLAVQSEFPAGPWSNVC